MLFYERMDGTAKNVYTVLLTSILFLAHMLFVLFSPASITIHRLFLDNTLFIFPFAINMLLSALSWLTVSHFIIVGLTQLPYFFKKRMDFKPTDFSQVRDRTGNTDSFTLMIASLSFLVSEWLRWENLRYPNDMHESIWYLGNFGSTCLVGFLLTIPLYSIISTSVQYVFHLYHHREKHFFTPFVKEIYKAYQFSKGTWLLISGCGALLATLVDISHYFSHHESIAFTGTPYAIYGHLLLPVYGFVLTFSLLIFCTTLAILLLNAIDFFIVKYKKKHPVQLDESATSIPHNLSEIQHYLAQHDKELEGKFTKLLDTRIGINSFPSDSTKEFRHDTHRMINQELRTLLSQYIDLPHESKVKKKESLFSSLHLIQREMDIMLRDIYETQESEFDKTSRLIASRYKR